MKRLQFMVLALAAGLILVAGCGKSGSVDTSKVEKTFASAAEELKAEAEKVVAAVKREDYAGAQATLQKLASNAQLTAEQKQAIQDVIAQVQAAIKAAAEKVAADAQKMGEDLKKSLPKP